ncbi:anion permease [Halorarum salinum]|uniref:Anion permease n=1 Tax=Halorarum salinum TaxID=2743089 RepID=A0A7D5L9I9_9EURY|nr:anion permease [Halobaculum salinum]QLG61131.1 anion permease [Halobaculum salinum]
MASLGAPLAVSPPILLVTVSVAASFAFMRPVATPPNGVVFGSRCLSIPRPARVGFWVNLLGIAFLTLMTRAWVPVVRSL